MKRMILGLLGVVFATGILALEKEAQTYAYNLPSPGNDKITIKAEVENGICTILIYKDGETKEFSFPIDDLDLLDSLDKELSDLGAELNLSHVAPFAWSPKSTWLGVRVQSLTDQLREHFKVRRSGGALVSEVVEESPAEKAGLKAGDIILSVERENVEDSSDLVRIIRNKNPGDEVRIKVVRNGRKKTVTATLESQAPGESKHIQFFKEWRERELLPVPMPEHYPSSLKEDFDSLKKELDQLREELQDLKKEIEEDNRP